MLEYKMSSIPEEVFALHLPLEAGDVSVAEVLAELLHLLQLQQVDPQHLDGPDHLKRTGFVSRYSFFATPVLRTLPLHYLKYELSLRLGPFQYSVHILRIFSTQSIFFVFSVPSP